MLSISRPVEIVGGDFCPQQQGPTQISSCYYIRKSEFDVPLICQRFKDSISGNHDKLKKHLYLAIKKRMSNVPKWLHVLRDRTEKYSDRLRITWTRFTSNKEHETAHTSWRASLSSASSGARIASIGGMSSSFWAAWTLLSVASAANWAAMAAFFSSFIFLISRFYKDMSTSSVISTYQEAR